MNTALESRHLAKRYGDLAAVDDLSLQVARGEIYVLVGLNGAGKSTTIRMLLGMVRPTHGEVRLLGRPIGPGQDNPWASVGYLIETPHAYPELTARENLEIIRRLRPGTPALAVDEVLERLGLVADADRRAAALSDGNTQRLALARALLHRPELLILDEPARGLDPAGLVEIRRLLIEEARTRGVTVFMSSHLLGEVAQLADRIGIMHRGRLLQELDTAALQSQRSRRLLIGAPDLQAARLVLLNAGFPARIAHGNRIELNCEAALARPDQIAARLVYAGHAPTMLQVQEENLEDYFLRMVESAGGVAR